MSIRVNFQIFGVLAGLAAFGALPAGAQDAQDKATVKPAGGQPLSQALTNLATADGFEVRGIDRIGDETVQTPKSDSSIQALRHMLNGYAYTVEMAPSDGKDAGKLTRVSILGHVGDNIADATAPAAAMPGPGAMPDAGTAASQGEATLHPVNHMLQAIARSTIPRPLNSTTSSTTNNQLDVVAGGVGSVPAVGAGSSAGTGTATDSAAAATGDNSGTNATDMAALTRTASANLGALVQSLKAACPAGGKC